MSSHSFYSCNDVNLVLGYGKTLMDACILFTKTVVWSLSEFFQSQYEVSIGFEMNPVFYSRRGETIHARNLLDDTFEQLEAW